MSDVLLQALIWLVIVWIGIAILASVAGAVGFAIAVVKALKEPKPKWPDNVRLQPENTRRK